MPNNKDGSDTVTLGERESKLLGNMMNHLMSGPTEGVSFRQSSKDMDFMERTKTWRDSWCKILTDGYIEACSDGASTYTSDHKLTQKGKDYASTPEYQEYLKDMAFTPATNEEHQNRIKKRLKEQRWGPTIFDLLLEHGKLTRKELAGIIGTVDRSHRFSYGLQELVKKDLVVKHEKMFCILSPKAFLAGEQPSSLDDKRNSKLIEQLINDKMKTSGKKKNRKTADNHGSNESNTKKKQKIKKEMEVVKEKVSNALLNEQKSSLSRKERLERRQQLLQVQQQQQLTQNSTCRCSSSSKQRNKKKKKNRDSMTKSRHLPEEETPDMCEYEKLRCRNMKRNYERLKLLGLA